MEKDIDISVIRATQVSLGKYIKRPPLTEKLLKKPPFRFLHDIITTVIKTTGFYSGLFPEDELISDNVKDKDTKIIFLQKVISVLASTTGQTLSVKPSKIVAGQDPEKTNEFLQCLAYALDNNLSSDEAVKNIKNSEKPNPPNEKIVTAKKNVNKDTNVKRIPSKSSDKFNKKEEKKSTERSLTRNEKDKIHVTQQKQKEILMKKDGQIKKPLQTPKTEKVKSKIKLSDNNVEKIVINIDGSVPTTNNKNDNDIKISDRDTFDIDTNIDFQNKSIQDNIHEQLNSSYTISREEIKSSSSSQDFIDTSSPKIYSHESVEISPKITEANHRRSNENNLTKVDSTEELKPETVNLVVDTFKSYSKNIDANISSEEKEYNSNIAQPINSTLRPSSSRPGAPRARQKYDSIITNTEPIHLGKVNIIVEGTGDIDEQETSIVIVDQHTDYDSEQINQQEELQLSAEQHGHLVQQILNSQKEYTLNSGNTEIEWQFSAQKSKEALYKEIEDLKFNIQALSRISNPLGKLLDHLQEDVEVMRQDLQQWTTIYEETTKDLLKQKTINEESLLPLHAKLKQLDVDIEEKRDKVNDLKIVIHKNSTRIEKLLPRVHM